MLKKILMMSLVLCLSGCVSSVKVSTLVTNPKEASEVVIVRPLSLIHI